MIKPTAQLRLRYEAPQAEVITLSKPLNLLVHLSASLDFEDFEDGDDLDVI